MAIARINTIDAESLPRQAWTSEFHVGVTEAWIHSDPASDARFEITKYQNGSTKIHCILENCNSQDLGDRVRDAKFYVEDVEQPDSATGITHYSRSRIIRTYWIGQPFMPPTPLNKIHELIERRILPNYDFSWQVGATTLQNEYQAYLNSDRRIYGGGNMQKAMGAGGAHPQIGPYPAWCVQWIYTGDPGMAEKSCGNARLAAAFPVHIRERDPARANYGRPFSIFDRPTVSTLGNVGSGTSSAFKINRPESRGGWEPEVPHQPDFWTIPYLATGEHVYLEEMKFWLDWSAAWTNWNNRRGPIPSGIGYFPGTDGSAIRGQAWCLRNRVNFWLICPDSWREKPEVVRLVDNFLAALEGVRRITGTQFENTSPWTWGRDKAMDTAKTPIHWWEDGDPAFVQGPVDAAKASAGISTWESNFMMFALGRAKEAGFRAGALVAYLGKNIADQLTSPDYSPYLIATNRSPTVKKDGTYVANWKEAKDCLVSTFDAPGEFYSSVRTNADHGYSKIARAAVAASEDQAAWSAYRKIATFNWDNNPKWAISPRSQVDTGVPGKPIIVSQEWR